ncbi:MAG: 16S rRNA (uracil(1498)-N(3))-methyltransferase [Oscillospiraceae bacterium]|nr:16S rRNA (uracil(1498)-N(3))-methyltransferase [Oscillospiraceae bacterium]
MPRFFVSEPPSGGIITIDGSDAVHIGKSLRMAVGDELTVCRNGIDYQCEIIGITREDVTLKVISESPSNEPNIQLTLFMAMPKLDKLELIVQKSVELGVVRICPVLTKRCISRPDNERFKSKRERLQKIALEAAKQSGRGIIPEVSDIMSFDRCVSEMARMDLGIVCYEKGGVSLRDIEISKAQKIGLFIGSEGGFEPGEIEILEESGIRKVWLGDRILRCETAPLAATTIIMFLTGNM